MSGFCHGRLSRPRIDIPERALERRLVLRNKLADPISGSLEVSATNHNLIADQCASKPVVLVLVRWSGFRGGPLRTVAFLRQQLRNALFCRFDRPTLFGRLFRQFRPGVQVLDSTQLSDVPLSDVAPGQQISDRLGLLQKIDDPFYRRTGTEPEARGDLV